MNYVEPIRNVTVLENMCDYLEKTNERNLVLFQMGIYTGLRVSDILKLRVKDVKDKEIFSIKETKTRKKKMIMINPILKRTLKHYCEDKEGKEFLIKSRNGYNNPLTRERAYQIIKELGEMFGIYDLGTHSMRKTFGYHYYQQTKDIALLQKIFNHSSPSITLRYIGVDQDYENRAYKTFRYK